MYAAVAEEAVRSKLAGFNPQNLSNTVWAFATADQYHPLLFAECVRVVSDSLAQDPSGWSIGDRSQLHQWQLWLSLEHGADAQQYLLSASQRQLCCAALREPTTTSKLQRSVWAAILGVRSGSTMEYVEPLTGYSLDLALPSSRIAIEVDGPSHFLLPDKRKPNGSTLLKRRLLTAAGWRVINVPFYEWEGQKTDGERHAYLERALAWAEAQEATAKPDGPLPSAVAPHPPVSKAASSSFRGDGPECVASGRTQAHAQPSPEAACWGSCAAREERRPSCPHNKLDQRPQ